MASSVFGIGNPGALHPSVVQLSQQLGDLQVQLGTGRKSQTYSGLGASRTLALDMRAEISQIEGYNRTIQTVSLRLDVAEQALTRMDDILADSRSSLALSAYEVGSSGQTLAQFGAREQAQEFVALLNSNIGGAFVFSGKETDKEPVVGLDTIVNGDGVRDGLKTFVAERALADAGADGRGRLVLSPAVAGAVSLSEDVAGHPFGLKLDNVVSSHAVMAVSGPAGSPAQIDINFGGLPPAGEKISVVFDLPDGTTETLTLAATNTSPPADGQFLIGADATETGDNFRAALAAGVETLVATAGAAASASQAASNLFDFDAVNRPQRVDGPPFETATGLVDATASDTVFWYKGEIETADPRDSVKARIDDGYTLSYGLRANEEALRDGLKFTALLSVITFDANVPTDEKRYSEIKERLSPGLLTNGGNANVRELTTEVAIKRQVLGATEKRHEAALGVAQTTLDETEGADINEVGARILALQTHLQASFQVTSILARLNLAEYL